MNILSDGSAHHLNEWYLLCVFIKLGVESKRKGSFEKE